MIFFLDKYNKNIFFKINLLTSLFIKYLDYHFILAKICKIANINEYQSIK